MPTHCAYCSCARSLASVFIGRERRHVLLVEHETADPERRHRQAGGAVTRERPFEHGALAGEPVERRRERDLVVVGREIVAPQAVDDEEEDVGPDGRGRAVERQRDRPSPARLACCAGCSCGAEGSPAGLHPRPAPSARARPRSIEPTGRVPARFRHRAPRRRRGMPPGADPEHGEAGHKRDQRGTALSGWATTRSAAASASSHDARAVDLATVKFQSDICRLPLNAHRSRPRRRRTRQSRSAPSAPPRPERDRSTPG